MKKGLLSLLAVALTIVSCQNYDDQFAELTTIVNGLKTEVAGISAITTEVGDLKSKVDGLVSNLGNIPTTDNTESIAQLVTDLGTVSTEIDALELLLDDVTSAADLVSITDALAILSTNVDTLLSATGEVSGSIVINSTATLATAGEFILLTSPSPAAYVVTGLVNIDHSDLTGDEITLANQLTSKILGVGATLTTSGTVELPKLSYVTGAYTRNGLTAPNDGTLTSIGGNFTIDGKQLTVNFPVLTSVLGDVVITTPASVTSIDLSAITTIGAGKTLQGNAATFANALTVNTGKFIMTAVTAPKATTVTIGQASSVALIITAGVATAIDVNSLAAATGLITVVATDTTIVHFDKLAGNLGVTCNTKVSQFHLPALVATGGAIGIKADVIDFTKLKTVGHAVTLTGAAVTFPGLQAAGATISAALTLTGGGAAVLDLSGAVVTGSVVSTATSIEIAASSDGNFANILNALVGPKIVKVNAQTVAVSLTTANRLLTSLDVTGKTKGQTTNATLIDFKSQYDCIAALVDLKAANFGDIIVGTDKVTANTSLKTIATSGYAEKLEINQLDGLTGLTVGHTGWGFNLAVNETFILHDSDLIKSVDLSGLTKLWVMSVSENDLLAVVTAPATTTLLANNSYGQFTLIENSIQATWTAAVAGGGAENIEQPSFSTWVKYFNHLAGQGIVLTDGAIAATTVNQFGISFDYDINSAAPAVAGKWANSTSGVGNAGTIDTTAEYALIDANN